MKSISSRYMSYITSYVICVIVGLATTTSYSYPDEPEADIKEDPQTGEHSVVMKQRFDYSTKELYHVLTDYKNFPDYMPHTRLSKILKEQGNTKWVKYRLVFLLWFEVNYVLKIEHSYADTEANISWVMDSGKSFDAIKGSWHLKALTPHTTGVTYSSMIEPKAPIPGPIFRLITQQSVYDLFEAVDNRLSETVDKSQRSQTISTKPKKETPPPKEKKYTKKPPRPIQRPMEMIP
ncbi:MAG: hypothetical protein OXC44_00985 [Proteobacteria bacterium]|nr:hypothetical protein [Pseudomonadota bacterium]